MVAWLLCGCCVVGGRSLVGKGWEKVGVSGRRRDGWGGIDGIGDRAGGNVGMTLVLTTSAAKWDS